MHCTCVQFSYSFNVLADPISSSAVMAVLWFLIAVMGITAKEVFCKIDPTHGEPPPLPEEGKYLCISTM